jgi:acyl-CoA thioesterase FadM
VLEVRIGLVKIGKTSFTYEYEIAEESGATVATARTVMVMYDYATRKPMPVSDMIRARLPVPVSSGL